MRDNLTCDVAIIGAGTAGLAAERAARSNGASTLLIDPHFAGTTCATVGCMPSKLLIAAAHGAQAVRAAANFGVRVQDVEIDGPAVMARVQEERDRFVRLTRQDIDKLPDEVRIRGKAKFVSPDTLAIDDGRTVKAGAIVIATGASPHVPEAYRKLGKNVLTNETIFDLDDLPASLAVVGSGAIGLELAQAMARLGVEVTIFDEGHRLGGVRCDKVHAALASAIGEELTVRLGIKLEPSEAPDGIVLKWSGDHSGESSFDKLLVATGRHPNLDGLNLSATGLELDDHGVPCHDRATMRCGTSAIFMAGDAAQDLPLLHEASHDGAIAGRNAVAFPATVKSDRFAALAITFTSPPLCRIGQSEDDGVITATADFSDQGRARVEGINCGVLTIYAAAPDGRLIGADMFAPAGEHLGHMLAWAVQMKLTATQLLELPFYHPTIEEGLKPALRTICAARPLALPADQDTGTPPGG